ncbi:Uncharacterised protein [Chryseobacterium nakagawai]|uniref:Uncharacterized protein n=1 Tax=Chryseobacterium nakagawai TaxID=1241982 RepID=A0AAD0YKV5_CHRNA|nr:hypothetical protein [Chryseobacterium nakagawai]AZA91140.1 hypothetical protein EG343_11115 [Chryseobacterium nakagawai]VEH22700.1 Uncharacterised protein [Chryseobacterium nakagawai]
MSHQEKQEIFDRFSKENYKEKFEEFLMYTLFEVENGEISKRKAIGEITDLVFAACDLVQTEQQKRIAERFKTLAYSDQVGDIFVGDFEKMEDSITNPENKIQ